MFYCFLKVFLAVNGANRSTYDVGNEDLGSDEILLQTSDA